MSNKKQHRYIILRDTFGEGLVQFDCHGLYVYEGETELKNGMLAASIDKLNVACKLATETTHVT